MIDRWDTGYRSPDWDSRPDWAKRLDYHDTNVDLAAADLVAQIRRMCRSVADEDPGHDFDYTRNVLALILRQVGAAFGMNPRECAPSCMAWLTKPIAKSACGYFMGLGQKTTHSPAAWVKTEPERAYAPRKSQCDNATERMT
jgi:hypothetical protein